MDSYQIVDIERTPTYHRVVRLAAKLLDVPTAAISLISEGRQWFLAKTGLDLDETPREHAFCAHAICGTDVFVVEDASLDPRFRTNPLVTAEGGIRFYAGAPLEAADGLSLGALCAIDSKPRSITEDQRETLRELAQIVLDEFELRKSLMQLNGEIQRREALERDLTDERNRALVLAQETERLGAAKSNFLANMSHEIRTPMNGVIGMSELLLDTPLDDHQRDSVRTILRSAEGLLGVLNDILDFSKIEAGRLELAHEAFHLESLVEEVCDIQMSRISDRPVELSQFVNLPSETLLGDETRLRQVLNNLVGNAAKFTERGFVCVTASLAEASALVLDKPVPGLCIRTDYAAHRVLGRPMLEQSTDWLVIRIQDTGIGMSAEQLDRLTQAYAQADDSITRRFGGTGLGLTISLRLIEAMRGGLTVSSSLGQGSCFAVYLPAAFTEQQFLTGQASQQRHDRLRGCRVLVVDDLALNTEIISRMLSRVGCLTQTAGSTEEALARLEREQFDLVVTDFMMPGASGADLVERYRAAFPQRPIPFILASSAGYVARGKADQELFAAAISKPIRVGRLVEAVMTALGDHETASQGSRSDRTGEAGPSPMVVQAGVAAAPVVAPPSIPAASTSLFVLLAEDNPTNAKVAGSLLDQLGHRYIHVLDGEAAVQAAAAHAFDLILMDVQMPTMSGLEATSCIRQGAGLSAQTPIVALTANAMPGDREMFLSAGMVDYLSKPFRRADFVALLERVSSSLPVTRFDEAYWNENFGALAAAQSVLRSSLDQLKQDEQALLKGLSLAELRGMVHRLGGGIGMLGYLDFSHWCRTQEEALLGSDAPDTTGITQTLLGLVKTLANDVSRRLALPEQTTHNLN